MLHIPIVHAHDVSKQIPREKNFPSGWKCYKTIGSYVSRAFIEISQRYALTKNNTFTQTHCSKVQTEPFTQAKRIEKETEERKEDFLFEYAFIDMFEEVDEEAETEEKPKKEKPQKELKRFIELDDSFILFKDTMSMLLILIVY